MATMTLPQAEVKLRRILRDILPTGLTDGEWSQDSLRQYLLEGEEDAAMAENTADPSRREETGTITVTVAGELQDIPPAILAEFESLRELKNANDTGDSYRTYTEIDSGQRNSWRSYTESGLACYFKGDQLGILPAPEIGDSFTITYIRKIVPMAESAPTELVDPIGHNVCLYYAALTALSDNADINADSIAQKYKYWKSKVPKIRRGSRGIKAMRPRLLRRHGMPFMMTHR